MCLVDRKPRQQEIRIRVGCGEQKKQVCGATSLRLERTLTLAKIMDEGLLFHGVDASVSATDDCGPSRELALALYEYATGSSARG
jgi:hypothetical protein